MDEYTFEELFSGAEVAFGNKQYGVSLDYYVRALELKPDDLYILSRAGSICIVLGRYEDAFKYFLRGIEVDPNNGDNYYNLGNAYYFVQDYTKCLDMYTKAEMIGCSPEVLNKLYFQKAMLCGARGDIKSALSYLKRYENAYADDIKSMDPRVLSEKVKLQMAIGAYEEAELSAAKLLNMQPTRLQNYIIYFHLLMALKKYDKAEQILLDAGEYAELSDKDRYVLGIQKAAFYTELISVFIHDEETAARCEQFASEIYTEMLESDNPEVSRNEVKLNLANLYMKAKRYDAAIALLKEFLPAEEIVHCEADLSAVVEMPERTDNGDETVAHDEEAVAFTDREEEVLGFSDEEQSGFADGEEYTEFADDEELFGFADGEASPAFGVEDMVDEAGDAETAETAEAEEPAEQEIPEESSSPERETEKTDDEFLERVRYILMSCYISVEAYTDALKMAEYLKDSEGVIYRYFSRYCEAYAIRSLAMSTELYSAEEGERKYAETIAFYRTQMMKNPKDKYAIVLRSRMYAEQGYYAKAEEMAKLLGGEEKTALQGYIEQCRSSGTENS